MIRLPLVTIRQTMEHYRNRFRHQVVVLLYHRVVDLPSDPQLLAVSPHNFAEHLEILNQRAQPLTLNDLNLAIQSNKLPRRGVVITFDDGYADNLQQAKPLLEHHGIPATVFIAVGQMGLQQEFWWDELERILLQPGTLPPSLSLTGNGAGFHWEIGEQREYSAEDFRRYRAWHVEQSEDPTCRHRLYRALYEFLHGLAPGARQCAIEELQRWAAQSSLGRPSHRALTAEQIVQLEKGDIIETGAHTMTHAALGSLTLEGQHEEIVRSKTCLEEIVGHPITSFAYPHGSYSEDTVSLLQQAGFTHACSSETAVVRHDVDSFRLPRLGVRNWDGEQFNRWLNGWL